MLSLTIFLKIKNMKLNVIAHIFSIFQLQSIIFNHGSQTQSGDVLQIFHNSSH